LVLGEHQVASHPCLFESTAQTARFTDAREPAPRSRAQTRAHDGLGHRPAAGCAAALSISDLSAQKPLPALVLAHAGKRGWLLCQFTSKPCADGGAVEIAILAFQINLPVP